MTGHLQYLGGLYRDFKLLTKPGLVLWVYISVLAGYALSKKKDLLISDMLYLFAGVFLSGCAAHIFNQYMERESDSKMQRTRHRPFAAGKLVSGNGFFIAFVMSLAGYIILFLAFNPLTAFTGLLCTILYVFAYTPLKKKSAWNTWVGALPGALPALIGGAAVVNHFPTESLYVSAVLYVWQIPHFLALAWKYRKEYAEAGLKMITVKDSGGIYTFLLIFSHSLILIIVCVFAVKIFPGLGYIYFTALTLISLDLLIRNAVFYLKRTDKAAMGLFFNSLYFIPVVFGALTADVFWFE